VVALALGLSVFVEAAQLFTLDRTTSVADVVANCAGAGLGAIAARSLRLESIVTPWLDPASWSATAYALGIAFVGLGLASSQPFDVTLDVSTWLGKLHALQHDPWQFTALDDEGVAMVQNALFAFALCTWWRRAMSAAFASVAVAFALEASQMAIQSRQPGLEDAVVRAAGGLAGALVWALWQPFARRGARPSVLVGLLIAAMTIGAAIQALSPFEVALHYRALQWLAPPTHEGADVVVDVVSRAFAWSLTYFPIGFCLAFSPARTPRARWLAVALTSAMAATIELSQGWIVGHAPSVVNLAAGVAGGWIGVWAGEVGSRLRSGRTRD
jgi:VanZ family protein